MRASLSGAHKPDPRLFVLGWTQGLTLMHAQKLSFDETS
jgi:hypothetical protein